MSVGRAHGRRHGVLTSEPSLPSQCQTVHLSLQLFPSGASKTILCYAGPCGEVVAWWCSLVPCEAHLSQAHLGDCKVKVLGPLQTESAALTQQPSQSGPSHGRPSRASGGVSHSQS